MTYTLSSSNSAFPAFLARAPLGMVFEPAAAAADIDGYSTSPIGTGPFLIETRDLDNETTVVRNENYWGMDPDGNQLPYLDSISFRPIPDEQARLDALLSGTVNAMQTLRQGTIRDARAAVDGGTTSTLLEFQGNNVGGGMFNMAVAPFDDLRVRLGLTQMNSQDNVIEALGGTGHLPAGHPVVQPRQPVVLGDGRRRLAAVRLRRRRGHAAGVHRRPGAFRRQGRRRADRRRAVLPARPDADRSHAGARADVDRERVWSTST